jgi:predicted nucleic acid-binding protein
MEKQKKVLDASVIIKGFTNEENSDKANQLIKSHINKEIEIITTELMFVEVLNSLRFKNKDEISLKKISSDLEGFQFKVQKLTGHLLEKSIEISKKNNLTIYDSIYIALAQFNGCPFITADKELFKIPNVIPLEKMYLS